MLKLSEYFRSLGMWQSSMFLYIKHHKENITTTKMIKNRNFCFFMKIFLFVNEKVKNSDYIAALGRH